MTMQSYWRYGEKGWGGVQRRVEPSKTHLARQFPRELVVML